MKTKPVDMYQIRVTQGKTEIPVGPIVQVRKFLEPLAEQINLAVVNGQEKNWRDARIVRVAAI